MSRYPVFEICSLAIVTSQNDFIEFGLEMFTLSSNLEATENSGLSWQRFRVAFCTEEITSGKKKIVRAKGTALLVSTACK